MTDRLPFTARRPLHFGACDPSGIAYFPAYLHLLVGVVEDFFADLGLPWPVLMRDRRLSLPTVKLDLTFSAPGYHGDLLDFALRVRRIGRSSLDLDHRISSGGRALWRADQRLVATSIETHASCPWPDDIRERLTTRLETGDA